MEAFLRNSLQIGCWFAACLVFWNWVKWIYSDSSRDSFSVCIMIYSILCWIALVIAVVAAEEVNIASKADFARRFHDSLTVDKPNYSHVRELLEAINDEDQILATEVMAVGDKLVPFPPMAHHLLNLHMIAKSPKDKEIIIDLLSLAIKKGLDVNALFRDDPPLFFKCLISKEFNLFVQVLNAGRKVFINQVIGRSRWVVQALNILYALPSEVVPIAKLLLHVEQRVHREENLSTSLNRTEVALSLLRGARLDKPTVRAEELWVHSETFRDLVLHISGMQYTSFTGAELVPLQDARLDPDRSKVLLLRDVAATLDELVNSMQKEIFRIILTDSRGGIALMHFLDMLVTPNQQGRNAFHFLSMSAAHHTLTTILNQYSLDMGESVSYDTHILAALSRADYRNHSALSYCQYRFHGQAAHCSLFDKVLRRNSAASQSPGGHLGADVGVDGELVEVESPAGNIQNNYSETGMAASFTQMICLLLAPINGICLHILGGWNPTLLEVLPVHVGQRCDIEEVWDADKLPPSPEFFERYINQGRPVIFRGVGKKHTEYMNVVNRNLDRARFLRRYGATKVPASVLPYGGNIYIRTHSVCLPA